MPKTDFVWPFDRARYQYTSFSRTEFERRHKLVREFMEEKELDALIVQGSNATWDRGWTNYRWLANIVGTQYSMSDYVIVPRDIKEDITVATIWHQAENPAKRARSVVDDVRCSTDRHSRWPVLVAIERMHELNLNGKAIGVVEVDPVLGIPANDYARMREEFPRAIFRSVADEFMNLRSIKSKEEIDAIEASARIGDAVMRRLVNDVRPGTPEAEVFGLAAHEMTRHGGELPTMLLMASTDMYNPDDLILRERPLNRTIEKGSILINEYAPRHPTGEESQIGFPVAFGQPSDEYKRMEQVMLEVYTNIANTLRPGNTSADIRKQTKPIYDAGYVCRSPLVQSNLGSLGLRGNQFHARDKDFDLFEDMVLVVEVLVSNAELTKGVFACDTWHISGSGPRRLNQFPAGIYVV